MDNDFALNRLFEKYDKNKDNKIEQGETTLIEINIKDDDFGKLLKGDLANKPKGAQDVSLQTFDTKTNKEVKSGKEINNEGTLAGDIEKLEQTKQEKKAVADGLIKDQEEQIDNSLEEDEQAAKIKQENEKQAQQLDSKINEAATELDQTKNSLMETRVVKKDKENRIDDKNSQIADIKSSISAKKDEAGAINTSTGDPETDSANASKKQEIESQIAKLTSQSEQTEQEKTQLEQEKAKLGEKESQLEQKITSTEEEIKSLEAEKQAIMDKILESASPETQQKVAECQAKIAEIKSDIEATAQEIDKQIEIAKNQINDKVLDFEKTIDLNKPEIPDFIPKKKAAMIARMHPMMQQKVVEVYTLANEEGLPIRMDRGSIGTLKEQKKGGSTFGTPNPYGHSALHVSGLAVDLFPKKNTLKNSERLVEIGKSTGLTSGTDPTYVTNEPWHFDMSSLIKDYYAQVSTNKQTKEAFTRIFPQIKDRRGTEYSTMLFYNPEELAKMGYAA